MYFRAIKSSQLYHLRYNAIYNVFILIDSGLKHRKNIEEHFRAIKEKA